MKSVKIAALFCVMVLSMSATAAFAQDAVATNGVTTAPITRYAIPASVGAGLCVIGAALGIGKLAASAVESIARQPEMSGTIQAAMIIAAALIEGFTFYAIYVCSTGV